jgi:predicted nucleic acid-binding protein
MRVIANTTVVSNFASIGQLELLRRLYGEIYISTEVYEEIRAGLEEGYRFYEGIELLIHPFIEQGWIRLTSPSEEQELRLLGELPARLHQGEATSMAIARHRGWLFLTDDRTAREESGRLGIRVSGSIGCLILSIERGLTSLEQANSWLREMIRRGYRSPVTDLTPLVERG